MQFVCCIRHITRVLLLQDYEYPNIYCDLERKVALQRATVVHAPSWPQPSRHLKIRRDTFKTLKKKFLLKSFHPLGLSQVAVVCVCACLLSGPLFLEGRR